MKESIFQRVEPGTPIHKRVKEIALKPETAGNQDYSREAKPDAKHEVYALAANFIQSVHLGIQEVVVQGQNREAVNARFQEDYLPYSITAPTTESGDQDWNIMLALPNDYEHLGVEEKMTTITQAANLYGELFWHVMTQQHKILDKDAQHIFRGLQTVIEKSQFRGEIGRADRVERFLMGGVLNAAKEVWASYLVLAYKYQEQFGVPMTSQDFKDVEKDLVRAFSVLASLQFDVFLSLRFEQKKERGVTGLFKKHDAEDDFARFSRMLSLHKNEEGLHADLDMEYIESFNDTIKPFPYAGEKRYGCPARSVKVPGENNKMNTVIADLIRFYGHIATITLEPLAKDLQEGVRYYQQQDQNTEI